MVSHDRVLFYERKKRKTPAFITLIDEGHARLAERPHFKFPYVYSKEMTFSHFHLPKIDHFNHFSCTHLDRDGRARVGRAGVHQRERGVRAQVPGEGREAQGGRHLVQGQRQIRRG